MGFGGDDFKNFRLWIDDEIESNCYSNCEDETFNIGELFPTGRKL